MHHTLGHTYSYTIHHTGSLTPCTTHQVRLTPYCIHRGRLTPYTTQDIDTIHHTLGLADTIHHTLGKTHLTPHTLGLADTTHHTVGKTQHTPHTLGQAYTIHHTLGETYSHTGSDLHNSHCVRLRGSYTTHMCTHKYRNSAVCCSDCAGTGQSFRDLTRQRATCLYPVARGLQMSAVAKVYFRGLCQGQIKLCTQCLQERPKEVQP